jgi:hypothetical protein
VARAGARAGAGEGADRHPLAGLNHAPIHGHRGRLVETGGEGLILSRKPRPRATRRPQSKNDPVGRGSAQARTLSVDVKPTPHSPSKLKDNSVSHQAVRGSARNLLQQPLMPSGATEVGDPGHIVLPSRPKVGLQTVLKGSRRPARAEHRRARQSATSFPLAISTHDTINSGAMQPKYTNQDLWTTNYRGCCAGRRASSGRRSTVPSRSTCVTRVQHCRRSQQKA